MVAHYIIMGSSYYLGTRIALHYLDEELDNLQKNINYIKQICGKDVSISYHTIQTESKDWNSIVQTDKFFKNVQLIKTKKEFIEILLKDRELIGSDIAKYILSKIPCTHLKLEKLVYMCYADYLCETKEKLFQDTIYAYKLGPVISSVYEKYKKNGSNNLEEDNIKLYTDDRKLPSRSRIIAARDGLKKLASIDKTIQKYSRLTAMQLVELTHQDKTPWAVSGRGQNTYMIISDELIKNNHKYEEA